jgi:serine/threonine protein kinase
MSEDTPRPSSLNDLDDLPTIAGLRAKDLVLGRFKLERCLGRGGMGEVWLVHDETLEEKLALKLLPRLIQFDERAVEDLKNETRRGRQLSHPNIVRVFDFYKDNQNVGIAMEFVNGENLAVLHAREPHGAFSAERLTPWARQLLSGLDYAHRSSGVVHRDLKPANLLIDTSTQTLKIADFGIARCVADSLQKVTMSAQSRGTLCYMSPEQAMGRGANPLDDLYAVGATLYELLAGTPPFYTGDITSQIQKVPPTPIVERQKEQGFNQPPPPHWEQVIMRCLAKERSQRPQSAAEVLEALGLGTGAVALPYQPTNTGVLAPTPPPVPTAAASPSPPTLPLSSTAAGVNTGSVSISTAAPVLTVSTHTQRTLGQQRSGAAARPAVVTTAPETAGAPRWLLPATIAGLLILSTLAGGGWWVWTALQKQVEDRNQDQARQQPPSHQGTSPVAIPAPPATAQAGQDWSVPEQFATLQAALDAVTVDGQKILIAGQVFKGSITIKKGVHLIGQGADKTILEASGQSGPVIDVRDAAKGVIIEGIGFQHAEGAAQTNGQPVARVQGGDAEFKNCSFTRATGAGLEVTSGANCRLNGCTLSGNGAQGALVSASSVLQAEDCHFNTNQTGVTLQLTGTKGTFIRCEFATNATHGLAVLTQAAGTARQSKFINNRESACNSAGVGSGALLDDCDISGSEKAGVQAEKGAAIDVTNCRVTGCAFGIIALDAGPVKVKDCKIKGQKRSGVVLKSLETEAGTAQLTSNIILENTEAGIIVQGKGCNPDVSGNQLGPNGMLDVVVENGARGRYSKNTLMSRLEEGANHFIAPGSEVQWLENIVQPAMR